MARASLTTLIAKIRLLVDDPSGAGQIFTDDQIQDALDARRDEARYYPLNEHETIAAGGGSTTYLTFTSQVGAWESDVVLVDSSYNVLTPATSDLIAGRWTFSTEPSMPVMITGFTHDLYGAAGDLLLQRATVESDSFDVGADGLSLSRNQKQSNYRDRANEYFAKARTKSITLVRTDEW
jgi:hypothetical protein